MKHLNEIYKTMIFLCVAFLGSCETQTKDPMCIRYIDSSFYKYCPSDCSYQGLSSCDLAYSADFLIHVRFVKGQGPLGACGNPYAASYDLYHFEIVDRVWGDFYEQEIQVIAMNSFFSDPFQEGWEGLISVKKFDDDYFLIVQQEIEILSCDFVNHPILPPTIDELKGEMHRVFNSFQTLCTEEQHESPLPREFFYDPTYYQGAACE